MTTYKEIAARAELTETQARRFVAYMQTRWPDTEMEKCLTGYASKWASRFKFGQEWSASDSYGQSVLRTMEESKP